VTGFLLDTHVLLWWLVGEALSPAARNVLEAPGQIVRVSAVTAWEIAIKQSKGHLEVAEDYLDVVQEQGLQFLPVEVRHAVSLRDLPMHHRDPFARMLVAQARVERLTLMTRDRRLRAYDVKVLAA